MERDGAAHVWLFGADLPGVGLYVSDEGNHRIQQFDPDGTFVMEWGVKGILPGTFSGVSGVAVDDVSLSVYTAEKENDRIQKFDSTGTFLTTWGSRCDLLLGVAIGCGAALGPGRGRQVGSARGRAVGFCHGAGPSRTACSVRPFIATVPAGKLIMLNHAVILA